MFVLLFLSLFPANSLSQSHPKVCLDSICFTGSWITTNKGLKFASFQGIKYGQAPIGKLRFKPPQARKIFLKTHNFDIEYIILINIVLLLHFLLNIWLLLLVICLSNSILPLPSIILRLRFLINFSSIQLLPLPLIIFAAGIISE